MLSATRGWMSIGLLMLVASVRDSYGEALDARHRQKETTEYHVPPKVVHETTTRYYLKLETDVDTTTVVVPSTTTVCLSTTSTAVTTVTVVSKVTEVSTVTTTTPTTTTQLTTTTIPTTIIVTSTITEFPTFTSTTTSTTFDPCPSTCSIYASTVNLFYWPPSRQFSYPATYVDTSLGYTFTSPSVYMMVPTMYGTNSLGKVGPDASMTIMPFNLDEVSTLVLPEQTATAQLTLEDLGTDCPRALPQSVIATKQHDSRCDPVLLAPSKVRSWAWPCNACGQFGLFDPPYAVPTLPGGLLGTTTGPESVTSSAPPPPPPASTPAPAPTAPPAPPTSSVPAVPPSSTSSVTPVVTAGATRAMGSAAGLLLSLFASVFLLY